MRRVIACLLLLLCAAVVPPLHAQTATVVGIVRDETGGVLPGVDVRGRSDSGASASTSTDTGGRFSLPGLPPGRAQLVFTMPNFGVLRRDVEVPAAGAVSADAVLHYVLSADVTVAGRSMFTNLADAADPAQNLVGIAQAASQGAITAKQLEARPLSRAGEVLETVPGVIVSQHSGEGKANQYYLRGFNLDHGTDFATTVAGVPVNMPTHAHGHGYSDLNFLIPELVGGVQYSKGPYYAEQGDFATAGAANITYVSRLDAPLLSVTGGAFGFGRVLAAGSTTRGTGTTLGAIELEHNDGPWLRPDAFRKINLAGRLTRGDAVSGLSVTGLLYAARWNATDQIPQRAVLDGRLDRYGNLDATDGGSTARASVSLEWQRTTARSLTRVAAYGIAYRLSLFSNFTYLLADPVNGDQFRQADRRVAGGARVTNRRILHWRDRPIQQVYGLQTRTDAIGLWLDHTKARDVLQNVRQDHVLQSSAGAFSETSIAWTPWLRASGGLRVDGYRFDVRATSMPANGGVAHAGIVSPKGGLVVGPFAGTEFYANAGRGFHSNDARGATLIVDPATSEPASRVTPLAPATGAEVGVRTVAIPHVQTSVSLWELGLASELVFIGDAGTTEAGRASRRSGVEVANYYHPLPWLTLDADLAWSRARFTEPDPAGDRIPGSVRTVAAAGITVDRQRGPYGSVRLRYFGPRPLVEDGSVQSAATTLMNAELGYRWSARLRLSVDALNLLDAKDSDIDYFYESRLPGEPAEGVADRHFHPALPRTFRATLHVTF